MSCDYASGLSEYADKGICGQPENFDEPSLLEDKIARLADWMQASKHIVVITGAGISTSAGIPDFRGPRGVWTLEQQGEKPQVNISFDDAVPTPTHMALVGQKPTGESCPVPKKNGRLCRGHLHDSILDWEHELPEDGIEAADLHCRAADLILCLGSTLQIVPCGALPLLAKKTGGKIVICNLQPTKIDKSANLILRAYVDDVMEKLMKRLGIAIPAYSAACDPTKIKRDAPMEYPKLRLPDAKPPAPRKYKKKPPKRETTSPDDATSAESDQKRTSPVVHRRDRLTDDVLENLTFLAA
ncbi:hypothetical protein HPB49_022306 [Dermacentor silvarum]|uniref:Uncharacterized protein n=1 Tax=Dermacentor silvarum TaxID=543639 RepID=A0ACB8CHJ4_DERSI|nr:hypothetical protein HPB49_022306 [Dermacentor silvarum]